MRRPAVRYDPSIDYYEILQVHPSAHQEVIKRAYRTIIGLLQAHPDLGGSHEDAVRVNEAYEVLASPETRKAYDDERRRWQERQAQSTASRHFHPPTPHSHAGGRRDGLRHNGRLSRTVVCARCGARNRIPREATLRHALCGKCRATLLADSHSPAPRLPAGDVQLSPAQVALLETHGELRLPRTALSHDGRLHCLRCRCTWQRIPSLSLPALCPKCRSPHWDDYRLFRCRHCSHQFSTANLPTWAYWLFPECPACHQPHWHAGCERFPLRWLLNKLVHWRY